MKPITILLDEEKDWKKITKESEKKGITKTGVIRTLIRTYLED